ncbi:MAG: hypothetical protein K2V38_04730, partial [Gemmataceae bacterium]|nr:hypothetical protein [Gemmataceae bacterium]
MNLWEIFPSICGYERIGDQVRLYVDGPTPQHSFTRRRGVRTALFRLYAGRDAQDILAWLDRNRAWQVMRVSPPYSPELGIRAVLLATDWRGGSAILGLARTRKIADDAHRERLRHEVRLLIEMVLENPVRDGEFGDLQDLEDAISAAPLGVELA